MLRKLFFVEIFRRTDYPEKPSGGYYADYRRYKQEIREDCFGRCVYCDSHENEVGGQEHMNLDHFRPQELFPYLENDPHNLVWACAGCNRLKSSHWPAVETYETYLGNEGFIDRFESDYWDFINLDNRGTLVSFSPPAEYMIELLALNRASRRRLRELRIEKLRWIEEFDHQIFKLRELQESISRTNCQAADALKDHILWLEKKREELLVKLFDNTLLG